MSDSDKDNNTERVLQEDESENLDDQICSFLSDFKKAKKIDDKWAKRFYSLINNIIDQRNLDKKELAIQKTKEFGMEAKKKSAEISQEIGEQALRASKKTAEISKEVGVHAKSFFSFLKSKFAKDPIEHEVSDKSESSDKQIQGFLQKRIVHWLFNPILFLYAVLYTWLEFESAEATFALSTFFLILILLVLPLYILGVCFYWLLARWIAKVKVSNFLNTSFALGLSSIVFGLTIRLVASFMDAENLYSVFEELGISGIITFVLILFTITNTVFGKLVWLSTWKQAFTPAFIVSLIYTILFVTLWLYLGSQGG